MDFPEERCVHLLNEHTVAQIELIFYIFIQILQLFEQIHAFFPPKNIWFSEMCWEFCKVLYIYGFLDLVLE